LAKWCHADYVEKSVVKIEGDKNRLILEDGSTMEYDVLALNVGSRTKTTMQKEEIRGVTEYALTTRPINDILNKIKVKEK